VLLTQEIKGGEEVKVIGKTEGGYILEASNDEVANLIGYYSTYDKDYKRPNCGDNIQISSMYK
jgi:hypothetical protein